MRAAILRAVGKPLPIEDVQTVPAGLREATIRTAANGARRCNLHVAAVRSPPPGEGPY